MKIVGDSHSLNPGDAVEIAYTDGRKVIAYIVHMGYDSLIYHTDQPTPTERNHRPVRIEWPNVPIPGLVVPKGTEVYFSEIDEVRKLETKSRRREEEYPIHDWLD